MYEEDITHEIIVDENDETVIEHYDKYQSINHKYGQLDDIQLDRSNDEEDDFFSESDVDMEIMNQTGFYKKISHFVFKFDFKFTSIMILY